MIPLCLAGSFFHFVILSTTMYGSHNDPIQRHGIDTCKPPRRLLQLRTRLKRKRAEKRHFLYLTGSRGTPIGMADSSKLISFILKLNEELRAKSFTIQSPSFLLGLPRVYRSRNIADSKYICVDHQHITYHRMASFSV